MSLIGRLVVSVLMTLIVVASGFSIG